MDRLKISVLLVFALTSGCMKAHYTPIALPAGKIAFPAIFKVSTEDKLDFTQVNLLKGRFVTNYIYKHDLLTRIRFQLEFMTTKKQVGIEMLNMQRWDDERGYWRKDDVTLAFDQNKLRNDYLSRINAILNDLDLYKEAREAALSDFNFNIMGMSSMTEVAANKWIEVGLIDRVFTWHLPLNEFREANVQIAGASYKYVASFWHTEKQSHLENIIARGGNISISLYTNSDRFASFNKGEVVEAGGILRSASKLRDDLFSFNLVESPETMSVR